MPNIWLLRWGITSFAAVLFAGCPLLDDTGGGGGGGGSTVTFKKGYVFVRGEDRNVYLADESDLSKVARLTTTGGARHPSLSRDGKRVVFARLTTSGSELVLVPTQGGVASVFYSAAGPQRNLQHPVFSPDGAQVVFGYEEGAMSSLGVVGVDGSGFRRLAGGSSLAYASASFYPDGRSVLAAAGSSPSTLTQLERVQVDTGSVTNVSNTLGLEAGSIAERVVISPDGTRAAFDGRVSSGASRIFVMELSSQRVTRLTDYPSDPGAVDSSPTWAGGERVAFSSDAGGGDGVYALPASARLTSGGLELGGALEPWYGP